MRQLFISLFGVSLLLIGGCDTSYDDSAVWDEIASINKRMENLEKQCNQMNNNLLALQNIVKALQSNDYITNISPIITNGQTTGYTITFAIGGAITILNGQDGSDGHTPEIGIKKDSDDNYYWTINGDWMLDEDGNKLCVGTTGNNQPSDGVTPKLKIENDWWYVSYDNGKSWEQLGRATNEESAESIFQKVTQDENYVYFYLTDGSKIIIPKQTALSIELNIDNIEKFQPNSQYDIYYQIYGSSKRVEVEVTSSADIYTKVIADDYSQKEGVIHIKTSDNLNEYTKVIIFVSDGQSVIMRTLSFEENKLQILNGSTKHIANTGGKVLLEFMTNTECYVTIPDAAHSWITPTDSTRASYSDSISLYIAPNKGATRNAIVTVVTKDGKQSIEYNIIQDSADVNEPSANEIWYTTADDQPITPYNIEGFDAQIISNLYHAQRGIIKFDHAISVITEQAFMNTTSLTCIILPQGVSEIGESAFRGCSSLKSLDIPSSVKLIKANALLRCKALTHVSFGEGLTTIGDNALAYCSTLTEVVIPSNIISIGYGAFAHCKSLKSIYLKSTLPPKISPNTFQDIDPNAKIYVPKEAINNYTTAEHWSTYAQCIIAL